MKHRVIALAAFALALSVSASAQDAAPAPGMAVENVIVTAPRDRPEHQLEDFIIAHAAPSPYLRKIARWSTGICPLTIGLPYLRGLYHMSPGGSYLLERGSIAFAMKKELGGY